MKEILPGIFMGTIPGETATQNDVNIYMIRDNEQTLFIDCGYDTATSRYFFEDVFERFDICPDKTRLFITHYHIDHTGMAWWFHQKGIEICMHHEEYEDARMGLSRVRQGVSRACGFHDSEIEILKKRVFDSTAYSPFYFEATKLYGDEIFEIGRYQLKVILLRGHTRAHTALYDSKANILFSGDHVIRGVSPVIITDQLGQRFLEIYYRDLNYAASLKVNYLFPAHNEVLSSVHEVEQIIEDTKETYDRLCDTVLLVLKKSHLPMSAYQVTLKIYHRTRSDMRKDLGLRQYLMTQKVLASLEYMHEHGCVSRYIEKDGVPVYDIIPECIACTEGAL